jgi:hypothetical protein
MNERDKELAEQAGYKDLPTVRLAFYGFDKEKFAALIRADEREALIKFFEQHLRSDWSDDQIIEALEARGNT